MAASEPADPSRTTAVREQALNALSTDDDPRTIVGTVLRALYVHHPAVRLDDVLELANHIDIDPVEPTAPETRDLDAAVQQVLDQALAHLSEWKPPEQDGDTPTLHAWTQ